MIHKSIKTTTITASAITLENGIVIVEELPPVVTTKKVTDKNVAKIYRNESCVTDDIKVTSWRTEFVEYTMDDKTFMKYATAIEK